MARYWNFALGVLLAIYAMFSPILGRNTGAKQWDPNGYVMYCPCSGRFSNQVELFLGSLLWAKTLDRTLVIPPIIEYRHTIGVIGDNLYAPFTDYFDLESIAECHDRVITLEDFLETHADMKWPKGSRKAYCSLEAAKQNGDICPRHGNPFGQFWSDHGIEFDESEIWEDPLFFNVEFKDHADKWQNTFPADEHPVIAFMNAPTFNPIAEQSEELHRHLQWSQSIIEEGDAIIKKMARPYVAIHLRNGADWTRTCDLTEKNYQRILSSYQCTGRVSGDTFVTRKMCIQSEEQVIEDVRAAVKELGAKSVFIGTDHVSMQDDIQEEMNRMKLMEEKWDKEKRDKEKRDEEKWDEEKWDIDVKVYHADPDRPQIDMYVMAQADHFIGNCVSAFSAFVKRERDVNGKDTTFFGWPIKDTNHDEL